MTDWSRALDLMVRELVGPEDEFDLETNGDPSSSYGEETEEGFDDMPLVNGWDDEDFSEDDEDEDDAC